MSDRYHLNQMIIKNISSNRTNQNCVLSRRIQWEEYSTTSAIFLLKIYNLNLIINKHHLQTWPVIFKTVVIMKVKRPNEFYNKEDYRGSTTKYNIWLWTRSFCYIGHYWDNWWNLIEVWVPDGSVVAMLISWFWWSYCSNIGESSCS